MPSTGARRLLPSVVGLGSIVLVLAIVEILIRIGLINRFIVPLPSDVAKSFGRVIVEEDILHRFLLTGWECLAAGVLLTLFGVVIGVVLHQVPRELMRRACETWVAAMASAPLVLAYPLFLVLFGRSSLTIIMLAFIAGLAPVILKTIEGSMTRRVLINVGRSFSSCWRSSSGKSTSPRRCRPFCRHPAWPDLRVDQRGRRRVFDQFRRPRPSHQRTRRTLRSPRHLCGDLFRRPGQRRLLHGNGKG